MFLLLTHSCASGLLLGILFCHTEDKPIFEGLKLLKQIIGENSFAGRGQAGLQIIIIIITDDCRAER